MSFFSPEIVWFLVGLALILLEFMIPGVILVFFGAGAWITALSTLIHLTNGTPAQLLTFAISSVVLLVFFRRRVRGRFLGHISDQNDLDENLDDFAGRLVTVTTAVTPGVPGGKVEFKGADWSAEADTPLAVGERAKVIRAEGITLIVEPVVDGQTTREDR